MALRSRWVLLRVTGRNGARPAGSVPAKLLRVSDMQQSVQLEFGAHHGEVLGNSNGQKDNKEWLVEFPPAALRVL